jgi:iron(III) transport system substrate-binding protein
MRRSFLQTCMALLFLVLNFCCAIPAFAQTNTTPAVAEVAMFQGANRQQMLLEGAKKEGELVYYGSRSDIAPVLDAFTKKYGIKVKMWRSGGENILRRVMTEARAGRFEADIAETSAPQIEALHREKMLQQVRSPYHADLMPQAIPAHKEWVGTVLKAYIQAYNTEKVKKEELPKSYQDLLDPKWKGRLGIEAEDGHWFAVLRQELGQEKAEKLFRNIVAVNGISVRKGHTLLTNLIGSGEVPLGLTVYDNLPEPLKQKGAPIETFIIAPTIAEFGAMGMLRKAPHPYSAVLFYDFMINEGQKILAELSYIPTTNKIETPLKKLPLKFIDPALFLDMNEQWTQTYDEIFTKKLK